MQAGKILFEVIDLSFQHGLRLPAEMSTPDDLAVAAAHVYERFVPYVIETAVGADRATFAFLCAAYDEEPDKEGVRVVLRLHRDLAPYKVAILPLSKKPDLSELSRKVWARVRPHFQSTYDETQAIGRRYRRQDEIGTPLCVTVDFESLQDQAVTIRDRDDMSQVRVKIEELVPALREKLGLA